jgi:hypothetical protein
MRRGVPAARSLMRGSLKDLAGTFAPTPPEAERYFRAGWEACAKACVDYSSEPVPGSIYQRALGEFMAKQFPADGRDRRGRKRPGHVGRRHGHFV